ncbi:MAG: hypothetical protein ACR2OV_06155 [Hyphomicrobiaceae bacterium]
MRTVDVFFSVMLGIALGTLLGNTWASTPSQLIGYQLAFVCATWCGLRVLFTLLGLAYKSVSESQRSTWSQWRSWLLDDDDEAEEPTPVSLSPGDFHSARPYNKPHNGLPRMFLSEWPNMHDRR